ncbi:MAG: Rne/Rng family ribonuclease [Candidatus Omnitrophica bacterium]|nr:Rne/Rng family ribonuclease [Candidatus Omnitrophota bacterium]
MPKQILFSVRHDHTLIGLFEDEKLVELFLDRPDQESSVGNIYIGKVTKILENIQSAFVDLGIGKDGFLPGDDAFTGDRPRGRGKKPTIQSRLKNGQTIAVQVQKDEIADKGKKLSMDLSLPGRYLVLMPYHKETNISKRISDKDERKRLQEILEGIKGSEGLGWIVRTSSEGVVKKELERDARDLIKKWQSIQKEIDRCKKPTLIHTELTPIEQVLRDHYSKDFNAILVDNLRVKQHIDRFIRSLSPMRFIQRKVTEYLEPDRLMERYGFRRELQKALDRRVWLKSGGYLIIEEAETLTAIDVNTGKTTKSGDQQKTLRQTNIEAAEEIARQLRLRSIGGIIVIDFIDMKTKRDNNQVMQILQKGLNADKAASDVTTFSEIGLVQITRQRTGESLALLLSEECPHCKGSGRILTHHSD